MAVLVLSEPFNFNNKVKKIGLLIQEDLWSDTHHPLTGRVVGWGQTENNTLSDQLKYVDLDIVPCPSTQPHPGKFCAFAAATGATTCQGDSGGGFFIYQDVPYLIGVVSTSASATNERGCQSKAATYNHFRSHDNLLGYAKGYLNVSITFKF